MHLTKHAKKATRKRMKGVNKFEEALQYGIYPKDTKGTFKRFLDGLALKGNSRCNVVIYKNIAYLFNPKDEVIITTFYIPAKFHKASAKVAAFKETNRNIR